MLFDTHHRMLIIRQLNPSTTEPTEVSLDHSSRRYTRTLVGLSIGLTLSSSLAIYKVYATQKRRKTSVLFLEDWLLLLGVVFAISSILLLWVADQKYGFGAHYWVMTLESVVATPKLLFASGMLSIWTHALFRFSLLVSTRRLYSAMKTVMHRICDVLLFIEFCSFITKCLLLLLADPKHIAVSWSLFDAFIYHVNILPVMRTACVVSLATDCLILLSPFPLIFKLKKLTWKRKCQLFLIFSFGFSTILASLIRVWEIQRLWDKFLGDFGWYFPIFMTNTQVEVIVAMITTCLPTAAFLFEWIYAQKKNTRKARESLHNLASTLTSRNSTLVPTISEPGTLNDLSLKHEKHEVMEVCTVITECPDPNKDPQITTTELEITQVTAEVEVKEVAFADEKYPYDVDIEEHDDDDNFFELLQPSDRFFPHATQLGPRPSNERRYTVTSDENASIREEV